MPEDFSIFFKGLPADFTSQFEEGTVGHRVEFYRVGLEFPSITAQSVVLIGCLESRRSKSNISESGLNAIRKSFYSLSDHFPSLQIIDFGNIFPGESVEDTYFALTSVVAEIVKTKGIALIIGGGQDLTYANYLAYQKLEQIVNVVSIDSRFDMGDLQDDISADCFLQKIVLHQPNILFNYSNLGHQSYYVQLKELDLMKNMYFDTYRLGQVQSYLEEAEPVIRTADLVSFDCTSIRTSDNPANHRKEPNGFYGEEACAISRYIGLSDKISSFGIFEFDDGLDVNQQSTSLIGQMLWYFCWGVANRKSDYPFTDKSENVKYIVSIENGQYDIVFYKSPRSDRWWMEVPYPSLKGEKYERHFMIPCSYADYTLACSNEIPDRWWQTYQKLG